MINISHPYRTGSVHYLGWRFKFLFFHPLPSIQKHCVLLGPPSLVILYRVVSTQYYGYIIFQLRQIKLEYLQNI